jgi:hypothetical protein
MVNGSISRVNGQFDYKSTGHVSNVGLMAQKAEEYGSHDKTFEIASKVSVIVSSIHLSLYLSINITICLAYYLAHDMTFEVPSKVRLKKKNNQITLRGAVLKKLTYVADISAKAFRSHPHRLNGLMRKKSSYVFFSFI